MFPQKIRVVAASIMLAALALAPESAAQQRVGAITIEDPWVATTNPGAEVAGGYVTLRNAGPQPDRLISADSTRAARVELHEMNMDNGVMRMRQVEGIDVPAGGVATLRPGGLHIMFFDIDAQFQEGQRIPVVLHFERAGDVRVDFVARPRLAPGAHNHEH
ncbi:copper chaperone PCu(A)C [Vitreimonas flagellata]|uniref:copper chaperone PCu(A)C n=1 Tax=Vitreimonas flagellata TaxID=2560861 RepID=UPI00142F71D3|nr:copper chaperone PCu(A)C [Vitreimonas flagellata]